MNYAQSAAYIESLAPTILNPSLTRFALFMDEHERLQDAFPSIHVGGTNGKGSTVAIVDSVLRAAGLTVGRFTGPHLLRWNERFHLNGKPIDDICFAEYATRLRELSERFGKRHPDMGPLTWFEFLTALAFFYFFDEHVDAAVIEVGLGGRWDATNVLSKPLVSAITTIDLDHTHILGGTLAEIAREKAGIIKPGVPVVTAAQPQALPEIGKRAERMGAPLYVCRAPDMVSGPLPVDLSAFRQSHDHLWLAGEHQQLNALVASAVLELAAGKLSRQLAAYVDTGFANVYWPGRLQYIPPLNLVMDGAHNVAGAAALRRALDKLFAGRPLIFVLGFFQNKNVEGAIEQLIAPANQVFASQAQSSRSVFPAEAIVAACRARGAAARACNSIGEAFRAAQLATNAGQLIVATGSFATVKETMLDLGWHTVEDGMADTWRPAVACFDEIADLPSGKSGLPSCF